MGKLTIKQVMATGEESEKYGKAYHVQFEENDTPVTKWSMKELKVGDNLYGEVKDGKFVKDPYNPSAGQKQFESKKNNDARNDGQRQGMCINNAATYVAQFSPEKLSATDWAKEVHKYASALYAIGDLENFMDDLTDADLMEKMTAVEQVFGVKPEGAK